MKSKVFNGSSIKFELENVVAVLKEELNLRIYLFGGFTYLITDPIEMSDFNIWYDLFLEEKYSVDEEESLQEEEIIGL